MTRQYSRPSHRLIDFGYICMVPQRQDDEAVAEHVPRYFPNRGSLLAQWLQSSNMGNLSLDRQAHFRRTLVRLGQCCYTRYQGTLYELAQQLYHYRIRSASQGIRPRQSLLDLDLSSDSMLAHTPESQSHSSGLKDRSFDGTQ